MRKGGFFFPEDATPGVRKAIEILNEKGRDRERVEEVIEAAQEAGIDVTPPNPISNLSFTKHENFIRLTWENPTSTDLYYLKVSKVTDADDDNSETGYVTAPTDNLDDLDTIATSDYTYTVVAVDNSLNESTPVSVLVSKETLPAPDEIFNEPWIGEDLELSWDHVDGFGVSGYRVQILNSDIIRRTEDVTGTKYDYIFAKNSADGLFFDVVVRVYTLDALGVVSVAYTESAITHVQPETPTNVVASVVDTGFLLSWTLSIEPGVTGYDISLNGNVIEQRHTTGEYLYKTLLTAGDYQFGVAARNRLGQLSVFNNTNYTVDGPAAPATLVAQVIDNSVTLKWTAPTVIELPIASYEIRKGSQFATAEIIGRKQGTFTIINESIAGTYKYLVAAVDSAENIGLPISITTSVDQPADYVLNVLWDNDFSDGTESNVLIREDGTAIAPYYVGQTWDEKLILTGATTWQDLIDGGNTHFAEPVPLTAEFYDEHDYGAILGASSISSNVDKINYNGGPVMVTKLATKELITDPYVDVVADYIFALNFQYVRDKFEFTSDGNQFAHLNKHTLQLDSKLKSDAGTAVITDALLGVEVLFNKQFVDVTSLVPGAEGDGSAVVYPQIVFDFVDNPYPLSFWVFKFDNVGAKITGSVPWIAKGY